MQLTLFLWSNKNKSVVMKLSKQFLTPREAAGELGIGLRKLYKLIAEGKIPCLTFGPRSRRIPLAALVQFALKQKAE